MVTNDAIFFLILFIYLFMAVLGLRIRARAFSSCGKWGPLLIAVRGPLTIAASLVAQAQQLWLTGPVAPRHVGSSQSRARTRVPRIGRQTPNHCATREALEFSFLIRMLLSFWCRKDTSHVGISSPIFKKKKECQSVFLIFAVCKCL